MAPSIVILAAGKGSRMGASIPKALQKIANKPMLLHLLDTLKLIKTQQIIIVVGYQHESIRSCCKDYDVEFAMQDHQHGTGHAAHCAMPLVKSDKVLVMNVDLPLISVKTFENLFNAMQKHECTILTNFAENPMGFGRIIRNANGFVANIIEQADATPEELDINEINAGIYGFNSKLLNKYLKLLENNNNQGELYLTDIISLAVKDGKDVVSIRPENDFETCGVNSFHELAILERKYQAHLIRKLQDKGVHVIDPQRLDLRGDIKVAQDVVLDVNVILEGSCMIEEFVQIGANCHIKNSTIKKHTKILPNSIIEDSIVGSECVIGPFARIRPGTILSSHVKIGNFVEVKKSIIEDGTKINHLSYIGDATIGKKVNVGAGVITCNYDGANKHETVIEDNVFIGSNTEIVAPLKIGNNATIAAGTTLLKNVPTNSLALSKKVQTIIANWFRPVKKNKDGEI